MTQRGASCSSLTWVCFTLFTEEVTRLLLHCINLAEAFIQKWVRNGIILLILWRINLQERVVTVLLVAKTAGYTRFLAV